MSLLANAKQKHKEKISKQFISFYDSVLYLGEPRDEALEFIIDNLRNEQTHLKLEYGELSLISIKRYQDDEDEYYYFTSDYIDKHLTECINNGYIDKDSPIYNLGFAKKSFIEMLVCFGLPVSEEEQRNTQSPDLAFNDDFFEVDYHTYEMIIGDRNELRDKLEKQEALLKELQAENERLVEALKTKDTIKPLGNQGYLDPDNKFYSIEMKLCHDTWNYLYKNGVKPRLAHTREVRKYLENYPDFEVNKKAIARIATITNPKSNLAKTENNTDS